MKFLIQTLLVALLSFVLQYFFPWWTMAIGAFLIGVLFANNGWASFAAGLLGVGLLWLGLALYIDVTTNSILTSKVANIFPTQSVPVLFASTFLVGGLTGGLAAWSGSTLTYRKKKRW